MSNTVIEVRPKPLSWMRSKWCARMHRRHTSMGYDDGGEKDFPVAVALCRKCGRLVVIAPTRGTDDA